MGLAQYSGLRLALRGLELTFAFATMIMTLRQLVSDCVFSDHFFNSRDQFNFVVANALCVALVLPLWTFFYDHQRVLVLAYPVAVMGFDFLWICGCIVAIVTAGTSPILQDICSNPFLKLGAEHTCDIDCTSLTSSVFATAFMLVCFIGSFTIGLEQYCVQRERVPEAMSFEPCEHITPKRYADEIPVPTSVVL